ncbi:MULTISPECIES: O-antigen ligase family protein [Methylomicrobium]|nr:MULTISPECIES: O-antigen ligase family protein [Methylomicrobium]
MQISSNINLPSRVQERLLNMGGMTVALFLAGIYFSTAIAVVASIVVGLIWLLSARFVGLTTVLKRYPVAAWSLLLFGCLIAGLAYGTAPHDEAIASLKKYRELLFIPVLLSLLNRPRYRDLAWRAFVVASLVSLAISFLMSLDVLETSSYHGASLKSRITHGIFIGFFAFYCLHRSMVGGPAGRLYLGLFLLAVFNVFFIVEGRTGQLMVLVLTVLFAVQRLSFKRCLLTCLVLAIFFGLFLGFSNKAKRVFEGIENTQAYMQEKPEQTDSSMGQRYTFWKYSAKLIAEKPLFGHGTGSFAEEYARVAQDEKLLAQHPHNEFLFIGVQLGLFGLIPYFGFLSSQFFESRKLPDREKWLAQGLLISLLITSLFNTPIYDHTEGHWFAVMIALCFAALESGEKMGIAHA